MNEEQKLGNPIIKDLALKMGINVTSLEGQAKLDALAETYAEQKTAETIENTLNPNSLEIAVMRRIQTKVFGGKLF